MRFSPIGVVLGTIAGRVCGGGDGQQEEHGGRMGISGVMIPVFLGTGPESEHLIGVDSIPAL